MNLNGKTVWLSCPTTVQRTELYVRVITALERTGTTVLDASRVEQRGPWTRQFSRDILPRIDVLLVLPRADGTIGHWTHSEMKAASATGLPVYVLDHGGRFWNLRQITVEKLDGDRRERERNYARLVLPVRASAA